MSVIETTATGAPAEQLTEALAPQPEAPVPAVVEHQAPAQHQQITPSPIVTEADALWQIASRIAGTDMVPKDLRRKPEAVWAVMLYGREIGLGPMSSLQQIHMVEGKPGQSAALMRATIQRAGHTIKVVEWSNEKCVMYGKRCDDGSDLTVEWNTDDAKKADLLGKKSPWGPYPRRMLLARATGDLANALFADCLAGVIYTPEELEEIADDGQGQQQPARPQSPFMSENNQRAFVERATAKGLDGAALAKVVHAATEGRTDKVAELHKTDVSALRAALEAWQPIEDVEVVEETPPAAETNTFETQGRQVKARKIADWLAANEVDDSDGSLTAATPEERRAIGESAGVANKAGTPPSDETWALVLDMVRSAGYEAHGDPFKDLAQ